MSDRTLTTEVREHVLLIGLNRPAKYNAFSKAMLAELAAAYTRYEHDDELRCAIVHAHGEHFTAGLDLAEVGPAVAAGEDLFPADHVDPLDLREPRRTKPVICAVRGYCFTIGIELMLASDIRIAGRDTRFAQMEVQRGIMPFGGATMRLPQVAGWGDAMLHLLTGDRFDAAEAHRIGLVQRVLEPDQVLEHGIHLGQRVARCAPLAVRESLRSARLAVERGMPAALAPLFDVARELMTSEDAAEGLQSFVERREAKFQGR